MVRLSEPCGSTATVTQIPGSNSFNLEVRNPFGLVSRVRHFPSKPDALSWLVRNYSLNWRVEEVA